MKPLSPFDIGNIASAFERKPWSKLITCPACRGYCYTTQDMRCRTCNGIGTIVQTDRGEEPQSC